METHRSRTRTGPGLLALANPTGSSWCFCSFGFQGLICIYQLENKTAVTVKSFERDDERGGEGWDCEGVDESVRMVVKGGEM